MLERLLARYRSSRRGRGEDEPVVLGVEMARAIDAEERHQRVRDRPRSPLTGTGYSGMAGEFSLHRFVESEVDIRARSFVRDYAEGDEAERASERAALTMDDFYTLLTFARRAVVAGLRAQDAALVVDGVHALAAIDHERVDPRDVAWAAALLSWATPRVGLDPRRTFKTARQLAGPGASDALLRFAHEPGRVRRRDERRCVCARDRHGRRPRRVVCGPGDRRRFRLRRRCRPVGRGR